MDRSFLFFHFTFSPPRRPSHSPHSRPPPVASMPRNAAAALPLKAPSNGLSHKELLSRQSPPPLAPLQYLQNQRRGSITDPSLHAAPNAKSFVNYRDPALPTSVHHEPAAKHHPSSSRPSSPYVFGDATSHLPDNSPRIRNLLRSPSLERPNRTQPSSAHAESQAAGNVRQGETIKWHSFLKRSDKIARIFEEQ